MYLQYTIYTIMLYKTISYLHVWLYHGENVSLPDSLYSCKAQWGGVSFNGFQHFVRQKPQVWCCRMQSKHIEKRQTNQQIQTLLQNEQLWSCAIFTVLEWSQRLSQPHLPHLPFALSSRFIYSLSSSCCHLPPAVSNLLQRSVFGK